MGILKNDDEIITKEQVVKNETSSKPIITKSSNINSELKSINNYQEMIDKVIKDANLPEPDYLEFSNALAKIISNTTMSEQQKYETLFLSFESMGVTSSKLINSATTYLSKLNEYKNSFYESLKQEVKVNVTDKQQLVEKLKKDLASLQEKIKNTVLEIEKSSEQLTVEETSFTNIFNSKYQMIEEDISKIKKYLNNEPIKS